MNNIDISQFNHLKKQCSQSFHQQKKLIAQVMKGEQVKCDVCKQEVSMIPASNEQPLKVRCAKGCTDIQLDIAW